MLPPPASTCSLRERLLDAAERLVGSGGGANLTLDAVAHAAGVSKGGLLYHFHSKDALLAAMIERHVDRCEEHVANLRSSQGGSPACADLKAWVLGILQPDPVTRDTGAALFAAAANNPSLLDGVRQRYANRIAQLVGPTDNFALAATIILAVDGLMLAEIWRMSPFTDRQRASIVDQLLRLADQAFGSGVAPENKS